MNAMCRGCLPGFASTSASGCSFSKKNSKYLNTENRFLTLVDSQRRKRHDISVLRKYSSLSASSNSGGDMNELSKNSIRKDQISKKSHEPQKSVLREPPKRARFSSQNHNARDDARRNNRNENPATPSPFSTSQKHLSPRRFTPLHHSRSGASNTSKNVSLGGGPSRRIYPGRSADSSPESMKFFRTLFQGDTATAFAYVEKGSYKPSESDLNEILTVLCRARRLTLAMSVINEAHKWNLMPPTSVKTGTIVIDVYGKARLLTRAFETYEQMMNHGIEPNAITYNALISACARSVNAQLAFRLFAVMRARGVRADKFTYGALIDACAKAGLVEHAFQIANVMSRSGIEKDQTVYSALIDACGRCGAVNRAFLVFEEMKRAGVFPNLVTFAVLIDCCGDALMPDLAFEVFREIKHWNLKPNVIAYTSLIDACAKYGWPERAELVFDDMIKSGIIPNDVTFGALIDAWIRVDDYDRALDVLEAMVKFQCRPSARLLNALISLTHSGRLFKNMFRVLLVMQQFEMWPPAKNYAPIIEDLAIFSREIAISNQESNGVLAEDENTTGESHRTLTMSPLDYGIWLSRLGLSNYVHEKFPFGSSIKHLADAAEFCGEAEKAREIHQIIEYCDGLGSASTL